MGATTTNDPTTNEQTKLMWFLLVVALGVGLYSVLCLRAVPQVREQAAQVPSLTCDQLIRRGPGGQRYVILTESCLLGDKSVSESDGETGAFEIYHPLYPATLRQPPQPGDLKMVLYLTDEMARRRIRDDRNERRRLGQPGLSGFTCEVVGQGRERFPEWARKGLRDEFPGIPLGDCWLVSVNGYEPTPQLAAFYVRHGVIAGLVATALLVGAGVCYCRRQPVSATSQTAPTA